MTKTLFRWFLGCWLLAASCLSAKPQDVPVADLVPNRTHQQTTYIISKVIDRYSFKKQKLDASLSEKIFDRYLETLDAGKTFFYQGDIDRFSRFRRELDQVLREGRLDPAFDIFRLYRDRVEDRVAYAKGWLNKELDFTIDENYQVDRESATWAKDRAELDDLWRKRVKNDYLSLKLSGKTRDEIRKTLIERYEGIARRVRQFTADDVFQSFINAYTLSFEPHTSYMSPSLSENFDISMSLSLEGIGAVLTANNELTEVQSIVTGGPAKLSGQLQPGDRIVGVGQGKDGAMVDVIGWRLNDVVQLIRGPKGTLVRLQIIPKEEGVDGKRKLITLVRDKIKLEEQAAKKQVVEGLDGMGRLKIGVIEIPTFYRDFQAEGRGDANFRSTTKDVRALLEQLQAEGVDGVVVDLRDNGGGSLTEATELTGLFIESGPVVQVKSSNGEVEIERDPDPGVAYAGPLAVLVNRNSASASEIFAGAIQDYRRGIVIGEPTFGKGTVQTLVDLDRFVRGGTPDLGRLRLTMAQFYRVNGDSTQHRGVIPDILFPSADMAADHGERALKNALPWDHIQPTHYAQESMISLGNIRENSDRRIAIDPGFQMLLAEEKLFDAMKDRKLVSLNETKRRAEREAREQLTRGFKERFRAAKGLKAVKNDTQIDEEETETTAKANNDEETKVVNRIQAEEAAHILADLVLSRRPLSAMR